MSVEKKSAYPRAALWLHRSFDTNFTGIKRFKSMIPGIPFQHGIIKLEPTDDKNKSSDFTQNILNILTQQFNGFSINNLKEKIKTIACELVEAGWGHAIEAQAAANAIYQILNTSIMIYAGNIMAGEVESQGMEGKRAAHSAIQDHTPIIDRLKEQGFLSPDKKPKTLFALPILAKLMNVLGIDTTDGWTNFINNHPEKVKQLYSLFMRLEYHFFDQDMVKEIQKLRQQLGVDFVFSAHPATVKGYNHEIDKKQPTITMPVDPGYVTLYDFKKHVFRLDPSPSLTTMTHGAPEFAPDPITAQIMKKYFGIDALNVGTIADHIEPQKVVEKWQQADSNRIIMASTSGNASSVEEITKSIRQFREYKTQIQKHPYTYIVFTGEHSNDLLNKEVKYKDKGKNNLTSELTNQEDVVTINVNWDTQWSEVEKQIADNKGKIIWFRTDDVTLTAVTKLKLQQMALVDVVKGGEAPLMTPQVGTLDMLSIPTGPNEPFNSIWGLLQGGSTLACFTQEQIDLWRKMLPAFDSFIDQALQHGYITQEVKAKYEKAKASNPQWQQIINNELTPANLFNQLDHLFKEPTTGKNLAKQITLKGYINLKNASYAVVAYIISRSTNQKLTQQTLDEIFKSIAESKKQAVQDILPEDFQTELDNTVF